MTTEATPTENDSDQLSDLFESVRKGISARMNNSLGGPKEYHVSYYENNRQLSEAITLNPELNVSSVYQQIISIFENCICRTIPRKRSPTHEIDMEEDDHLINQFPEQSSFLHMMIEIFDSSNFRIDEGKKVFNPQFVNKLMEMFYSEDLQERELLKTILHRVYQKFLMLRSKIRQRMKFIFIEAVHTNEHCPGITQMLDLLTSIVNGYATPLKQEHKNFLSEALIPLIKLPNLAQFEDKLKSTLYNYAFKDTECLLAIILGVLKYWPKVYPSKELILLGWIGDFAELLKPVNYEPVQEKLLMRLNKCYQSEHTIINEKAMTITLSNPGILNMIETNPVSSIKILLRNLRNIGVDDWNYQIFLLQRELDQELRSRYQTAYFTAIEELKNDPNQLASITMWQQSIDTLKNYDTEDSIHSRT